MSEKTSLTTFLGFRLDKVSVANAKQTIRKPYKCSFLVEFLIEKSFLILKVAANLCSVPFKNISKRANYNSLLKNWFSVRNSRLINSDDVLIAQKIPKQFVVMISPLLFLASYFLPIFT